jgi:hypothetical protein
MMLHFLVEGPSEKTLLDGLLPRLLPMHRFKVYPHQGKGKLSRNVDKKPDRLQRGLLDLLPATLRGFGRTLNSDTDRVVVLVDADDEDCAELLRRLRDALESISPAPMCLFRIAIEEVESWYLGDWSAIKRAFGKADRKKLRKYSEESRTGAWELFRDVIGDTAERKLFWAEKMSVELSVAGQGEVVNSSPSFRKFCEGVVRHAGEGDAFQPRPSLPKRTKERSRREQVKKASRPRRK